jgi:hypothetical protein
MSDFLAQIIGRSFGLIETVRPYVPSLFEPLPAQSMAVMPPELALDADPNAGEGSVARPTPADGGIIRANEQSAVAPGHLLDSKESERVAQPTQPPMLREPRFAATAAISPAAAGAGGEVTGGETENIVDAFEMTHQPQVAGTVSRVANGHQRVPGPAASLIPLRGQTGITPPPATLAGSVPPRQFAGVATTLVSAPGERHNAAVTPRGSAASLATAARPVGRRQLAPEFRPSWPQDLRRLAEPEPTIEVTIGRIDVRAELPPGPHAKARSAPKPTSLDEYLRRRAGRER